jgi:hypothetical protein
MQSLADVHIASVLEDAFAIGPGAGASAFVPPQAASRQCTETQNALALTSTHHHMTRTGESKGNGASQALVYLRIASAMLSSGIT